MAGFPQFNVKPLPLFPAADEVKGTDTYIGVDPTDTTESPLGTTFKYTITQLQEFLGTLFGNSNLRTCLAATTTNLDATYNNGLSGVGATLTNADTQAALVVDGVATSVGDRILVAYQTNEVQNGVYTVTTVGSGSINWVLTRATDYDVNGEIERGDMVGVTLGNENQRTIWFQTEAGPFTIGTTDIIFEPQIIRSTWNIVNSSPQSMQTNIGYIANTVALCIFTLPTTMKVGDIFRVQGRETGLFQIAQNSGQQIFFGDRNTTLGVGGYLQSTNARDSIALLCTAEDTELTVLGAPQGNITFV